MRHIFYDSSHEAWCYPHAGYTFGSTAIPTSSRGSLPFFIREHKYQLGPLVGILTGGTELGRLCGDFKRFAAIQETLQTQGGISFVFSPYSLREDWIEGYIWLKEKRWRKCRLPYPDVVYNRIPYRKHEQQSQAQQVIQLLTSRGIPLFNPCFFSKWELYEAFSQNAQLRPHLLETRLVTEEKDIEQMLLMHETVYIKKSNAAKGRNIVQLQLLSGQQVRQVNIHEESIVQISDVWSNLSLQKEPYIVQQALAADTHKGQKYDLRVAAHYIAGDFRVSGIGVRLAKHGQIVTHVPHGGEIITAESLHRPINANIIERLAKEVGQSLCTRFGRVREFSLDIGVDRSGHYYLFEANSKPMIFDEPEIYQAILNNLLTVFSEEAGFPLA